MHTTNHVTPSVQLQHGRSPFYPYPNETSFRLGEWFWQGSGQKSRASFRDLVGIVGNDDFCPEDVRHTKWDQIDTMLAFNDFDGEEQGGEWMAEDAGWKKQSICISVPFHQRSKNPGPKDYVAGDMYYRSIISVIREKLAGDVQQFHYEPFELFWRPVDAHNDVRVHGELYSSPAFLAAHRELQEAPRESGCNLQRVVVALMFWSDATHLTSFGTAKLWPCYLFFGNESKYRRSKPLAHLCHHVAYFQTVVHPS
jgi:hypothetical protein